MITAAADGSALGNPGAAGWAWYIDDKRWAAGGWAHATNNQGELQAVLELFRATAHVNDSLLVLCDSLYVINSLTKWMPGWKRKGWRKADGQPVLNVELMRELDAALVGRRFRFEWIKGHAGHPLNEAADERARAAATAYRDGTTVSTGPGWVDSPASTTSSARHDTVRPSEIPDITSSWPVAPRTAEHDDADRDTAEPDTADRDTATFDEALFTLDADATAWHTITLELSQDEIHRLGTLARAAGHSPEDYLRSLF